MILKYENIVIGSSLSALLFAAQNFFPVVFSDFRKPFRFDYFEPEQDLSFLKLPQDLRPKSLTTFNGPIDVGVAKYLVWERMMFLLSIRGHIPLSNLCSSIRASDNMISCHNEYSKIAEIRFDNCYYFGDDNTQGLLQQKVLDNYEYICYDWIAFNKGGKHDIDFFETSDDLVKQVWFYPSDRIDGNTAVKDACIVSSLNSAQLKDFNYSETFARFKLIHELESRGLKGLFNGYDKHGNPKHYKFKTTHMHRKTHVNDEAGEPRVEGVQIAQFNTKSLFKNIPQICMEYDRLLRC